MNSIRNLQLSKKPAILKFIFLVVVLSLIGALAVAPALAQATTVTDNVKVPIDLFVFVPCAAGGAGESVVLHGDLHILFATTIDDKGGFHSKYHFQPQGITGNGFTTGDKYQGTGVTQGTFNGKLGFEVTDINNFKIIGPRAKFLVHETFHITVNAQGQVTVFVDNFSVKCLTASYPSYP